MLWSVGGTEHHSERWETTDKASNDDEIPPKDLVEEVWASWRTLRDHWQSLQWWRNSSQRSCWRRLSIIHNVERPLTKPAMMTKFLPKILLSWADQWQRQQWRQNSSQRSFWRSLSIIQNVERPLQALSVVSQSFEWCSVPPTWQKLLKMIGAGPKTFCCLLSSTNLTKAVADDWSWSQNVLMFALFHQPPAADLDLPLPPLITSLNVLTDALSHQPVKSSWRWSRLESSITCW